MDDDDAAQARELAPGLLHKRIDSDRVIHDHSPDLYMSAIEEFMANLG